MTINKFTDLKGFKDKNVSELESIGITSLEDLRVALDDEEKIKEIVKTLSGIGPKTAMSWKNELADGSKSPKEIKDKEETKVEESKYTPSIKPEIDADMAESLGKRAAISRRRPAFKRQEWFRYVKLGESWRRPKGIHSKMRRNLKRRPPVVDIGFRGPKEVRGLHPSGFEEVFIYNVDGLENVNSKTQAVRIGGTVGTKKRIIIQDKAKELGIRVLNRMA